MKLQRLAELIKQYSPAHFRDVCASFSLLSNELEHTKTALSKDLMAAQKSNDFYKAREILDVQEELSQKIAIIQKLLSESEMEEEELDVEEAEELEAFERPEYSLYDMDDTVAYDIKEDPSIIRAMANGVRQPGKKRVKMSFNKADINSPVKIAGSDIWVETRRSAADIRRAILILLDYYNIPTESVKVYFRRDYTAMHVDDAKLE